jgi:hypothetical protein
MVASRNEKNSKREQPVGLFAKPVEDVSEDSSV